LRIVVRAEAAVEALVDASDTALAGKERVTQAGMAESNDDLNIKMAPPWRPALVGKPAAR